MTSLLDDDDPRKGIAALFTLGKIKKKGSSIGKEKNMKDKNTEKLSSSKNFNFISVSDATQPVDLNISLQPNKAPMELILGPPITTPPTKQVSDQGSKRLQPGGNMAPILEETPLVDSSQILISLVSSGKENPKPKDYSMRGNMITVQIKFKILLDSTEDIDVRTKALVIIGKLVNVDPSQEKSSLIRKKMKTSTPYLNNHMISPSKRKPWVDTSRPLCWTKKQKRMIFHTWFWSVTSLLEMKRDQGFMTWLKTNKVFTSVMTLHTTENARAGFFLGKGPHITNLGVFAEWVKHRIFKQTNSCPKFQLNVEVNGRFIDPSTKCRAIVVVCSREHVDHLKRPFRYSVPREIYLPVHAIQSHALTGYLNPNSSL